MPERALIHIRVNHDDTLEAWWYEPEPRPPSPPGMISIDWDHERVRYYLTSGQRKRVEISPQNADVLTRMAQIAERYR